MQRMHCNLFNKLCIEAVGRVDSFIHLLDYGCDCYAQNQPRAGSGVVRMDPLRFLARCRTR